MPAHRESQPTVSERTTSVVAPFELTADYIFRPRPVVAHWRSSGEAIALAVEVLPTLDDDLSRDLIEYLAVTLVERDEELRAVRAVLSFALAEAHSLQRQAKRLGDRLVRLLAEVRERRTSQPARQERL